MTAEEPACGRSSPSTRPCADRRRAAVACGTTPTTSDDALIDALRLSEGMSYKNAMADLPLGGGKAVISGNSRNRQDARTVPRFRSRH